MIVGNQICPTCDAQWKDIPTIGPAPAPLPPPIPPPIGFGFDPESLITSSEASIPSPIFGSQIISAEMEDTPSIGPASYPTSGLTQATLWPWNPSPTNFNDDDPIDLLDFLSSEPLVFNDDDPINVMDFVSSDVNSDISCRAPIDLVTVLDTSGSMIGTKIQLLKRAMGFVIANLGPSDRLSVIRFSHNASRLFPLLLMNDSGKQRALHAVNSLVAGGGTDIVKGLKKGIKVIEDRRHKNLVHSIMLLSDGKDSCMKTFNLKDISRMQIPVHTFGFGTDHDPIMLHSIAGGSKGTFSFIEAEGLIQDAFAQCIGGLLSVVVQDLQVHVHSPDPYVCLSQLKAGSYPTYLTNDNQTGSVDFGDLYADEERVFLVLINIPAVTDENFNDQVKLVRVTTEAIEVKLQRPDMVNEEDMVVSIEVDRQKNRLQAAEAMSNSRAAAERGDLPTAWSIIDGCRMQLSDTASAHAGDKLSVDLDFELQEVRSRMQSQEIYESTGRGYLLSEICSKESQKATARGDSTESIYQTASMSKMVQQSRAFVPNPLAHNLATVSSSSTSLFSTLPMASNGGGGGGTADDGNKASSGI
ncbi:hypothetical protein MKW98_010630 [Papaver atlanticum]|uniref:VWFA domain-containing protein n=1 Tax=Papaver atlanticum TaxID=357466 RepID=A0AAD4S340_9MAGN|nr:hypothetical protein MKW98_010630 [Papaver atlanticum]